MRVWARERVGQGWPLERVASELGVSEVTVRRWVDPVYDEQTKARSRLLKRLRYGGVCVECGGRTSYSGRGTRGAVRCVACSRARQRLGRRWQRDNIVRAIQLWAELHGRPPVSQQWRRGAPDHPSFSQVYGPSAPFDSWSEAVEAAGFPRPASLGPGPGKRQWPLKEARALRNQGLTDSQIGARYGVSGGAIYNILGPRSRPVPRNRSRAQRIADLHSALERNN
jgi:hypothetical protein